MDRDLLFVIAACGPVVLLLVHVLVLVQVLVVGLALGLARDSELELELELELERKWSGCMNVWLGLARQLGYVSLWVSLACRVCLLACSLGLLA